MNHLKNETSPYLLQHAENPVDWYPWSDEAFSRARSEDKPVFLSIGYSTCHWCHVMARESFESAETAELLNKYFISIKVDREERPDIDSVYMNVCQAFTGSGGWPMSIFMTWDKKPFFAGTYFPPQSRFGMPGFPELLNAIADRWATDRDELLQSAEYVVNRLKKPETVAGTVPDDDLTDIAVQTFRQTFDSVYGGFGSAPKFPAPHNLLFLMYYAKFNGDQGVLGMAEKTLLQMRKGGIFDHVGGGFSRYSTDRRFLAPHFEKMLYDNALLIMAYSAMYSLSGKQIYLGTAQKTADYVLREMTCSGGGYCSAQDADSDGVEGRFYTFTHDEIMSVLDDRGQQFAETFDITEQGNFEGANIINLLRSNDLSSDFDAELQRLYDYRKNRTKLNIDDKILLSWNSMMIAAMSMLYRVSRDERYLRAAIKAQKFIAENMCSGIQLFAVYREGRRSDKAFLDDYAYYVAALTELYHSTLDKHYISLAESFCNEAVRRFADIENGGFKMSGDTELFMEPKEVYDGAVPSGNSVMAYDLVRLYQLTEDEKYKTLAEKQLGFMSGQANDYPAGHCMFLLAKLMYEAPPEHISVVLKDESDLRKVRLPFLANVLLTDERPLMNDRTTYYVCRRNMCLPPTNELTQEENVK